MSISFFDDKAIMPNEGMVSDILSDAYDLWVKLRNHIDCNYPDISEEWKFYNKFSGWILLIKTKKRTLTYLTPRDKHFRVRFALSEKMLASVESSELPTEIKEAARTATPYMEGRSIDIDISANEAKVMAYIKDRSLVDIGTILEKQFAVVKSLVQIKFEN